MGRWVAGVDFFSEIPLVSKDHPTGTQDDEAVVIYLRSDRNDQRWKLVYRQMRRLFPGDKGEDLPADLNRAFAAWLDEVREIPHRHSPGKTILDGIAAYLSDHSPIPRPAFFAKRVLLSTLSEDREGATNALLLAYRSPANTLIRARYQISDEDFEELFHVALSQCLERLPAEDDATPAQLFSYFYRILWRRTYDRQARKPKDRPLSALTMEEAESITALPRPEDQRPPTYWERLRERFSLNRHFVFDAERQTVRHLLESLDEACARIIRQRYIQDLSYREIADINGYAVNAVGQRISRCLRKMRKLLVTSKSPTDGR